MIKPALCLLLTALLSHAAWGAQWGRAQPAVERWLDGQAPQAQGLTLQLAEWVEDGAFVPLSLTLHGAEPPVAISVLRSGEHDPRIALISAWLWQPPLQLATRVRLPSSQQVIVLARDGRGRVWLAAQSVAVLASSCLAPSLGDPWAGLGQLQAQADGEDVLAVRSMLRHPMETGRRQTADGQRLPRRLAARFEIDGAQGRVLGIELFAGLAANPYWWLRLPRHSAPLLLRWQDADGALYQKRLP
ncbi:thiosulfate oxidation carrier complex protein SoxZ [Pseudomonas sp. UBA2684]|uniref:thiosulfate oxidation carrier complex protein SoxZ n=1 Tax=Pseudomonas sp. UBA2684 TaxID=1947311 RepID=UPI0025EBDBD7|nr:thiosulfate oxidation carrier complex protein SoxZ [Pseudomonas sp. UBA2684]